MSPIKFSARLRLVLTVSAAIIFAAPVASATSKEFVLHAFGGGKDASQSNSAMISDASGNLYGEAGGGAHGFGAIFKLTHASGGWKESVIYSFPGGRSGAAPVGGLVRDENGNLYGTTVVGGNMEFCHGGGCGTVFELSPTSGGTWKETVLYRFGNCRSGCRPNGGVIPDQKGNLYGTTSAGGGARAGANHFNPGCGTVFKLAPGSGGWKEAVLHSFRAGADGAAPSSGLVFDQSGNLYGATLSQGGCGGCGTIFELSPTTGGGWQEKTILIFSHGNNGEGPNGPLILDTNGNLYGTTQGGGTGDWGVAFQLSPGSGGAWTESVLHDFKQHRRRR